ncbi:tRNA uridine-5-carboxymethylaminomethyl(34) synthesis GTPase MnmE [Parachitinimonas caeni]|uniref:tRNA modification GTPase MnmE n=1 Tax=Parachitinimonas caeni TaxID=3031301 RepID=A0ABT7DU17_9NEIS|nr:tRNA uridine-5-carboxymethylaminomethyl(34) synthesis GTPase MnmE [Parachitinimonas caeni]MDK2122588.1 tRNA uridine-5-carboxymethylaminomethyl(34) synthesis GTPase MnmE [Parachitinimonas caeni]
MSGPSTDFYLKDTIAAVATAPGRGGVGIVRVSGPDLSQFAKKICGKSPSPRKAHYCEFQDSAGNAIDAGLALHFPAPNSFTGEDVLELQGHGGPVILKMLLARCVELGARIAKPGEFTQRAFLNNKIDLAQAESVADLIDAQSEAAVRLAFQSLRGEFSRRINALQDQLIEIRALIEATLDFPEEEGVDFIDSLNAKGRLSVVREHLSQVQRSARQGSIVREGMRIVLIGQPNVGKSSLLNALAGDDVAIVTDIAGTTRDIVRETVLVDGIPLHVIDTAGLRSTEDPIERIGIERTWAAINKADMALIIVDSQHGLGAQEHQILAALPMQLPRILVHNKIDVSGELPRLQSDAGQTEVYLSAREGLGVDLLRQSLLNAVGWAGGEEAKFLARERHLAAIGVASRHLDIAATCWQQLELFAEELRLAQQALSEITGEFTADDLLGEIFGRFCIGK